MAVPAAIILLSLVFSSCKKSSSSGDPNSSSGYYMRFKLNGAQVEYTSQAFAGLSQVKGDSIYTAVLVAYKDVNAGTKNAVTITVFTKGPLATGIGYNDPLKTRKANGDLLPQTVIFWYDSTATGYLTAGTLSDASGNVPLPGVVANAKLTITDLTSTYVKGTFSGTVYRSDFAKSASITDGEFNLRRQ